MLLVMTKCGGEVLRCPVEQDDMPLAHRRVVGDRQIGYAAQDLEDALGVSLGALSPDFLEDSVLNDLADGRRTAAAIGFCDAQSC